MSDQVPIHSKILAIRPMTDDTSLFTLVPLESLKQHAAFNDFQPGQFVQLSVPGIGEIPISYCGIPAADSTIELCVRSVGRVTAALRRAEPGDLLGVRGPFGKGFPLTRYTGHDILMIAGGVGMAPVRSLLLSILMNRRLYGTVTLLLGARQPDMLLFFDEMLKYTEDGLINLFSSVDCMKQDQDSNQHHPFCRAGLLPDLVDACRIDASSTFVALCAPPAAYPRLIAKLHQQCVRDEQIHLSLERRMECGIGRCGHCAVGSKLCCVDGPVFSLADITEYGDVS